MTHVPNLRPETVAQHAEAFANAEGMLGSSEAVNTALLERMPKATCDIHDFRRL